MGLNEFLFAIEQFDCSLVEVGKHYVTYFNIGICHYNLKCFNDSLKNFKLCLELKSDSYKSAADILAMLGNVNRPDEFM